MPSMNLFQKAMVVAIFDSMVEWAEEGQLQLILKIVKGKVVQDIMTGVNKDYNNASVEASPSIIEALKEIDPNLNLLKDSNEHADLVNLRSDVSYDVDRIIVVCKSKKGIDMIIAIPVETDVSATEISKSIKNSFINSL